ncbi:MAG TPA: zf-HC2 domain-containing protein [Ktedonobacterales bacterium]
MGSDERTNAGGDTGDTGTELSCRELVELVTAYREGALAPKERALFEAHMASCPPCVHYVEQLDLTVRALGGVNAQIERESFTQELLKLFRAWKAETGRPASN